MFTWIVLIYDIFQQKGEALWGAGGVDWPESGSQGVNFFCNLNGIEVNTIMG